MSDIYKFRIDRIEENEVQVRSRIIHPDENTIHETNNFALQILLEPFNFMKRGSGYRFSMKKEEAEDIVNTSLAKKLIAACLEMQHGRVLEVTKEEYDNLDALIRSGDPKYEGVNGGMFSDEKYYLRFQPDYADFCIEADELISSVELRNTKDYPREIDKMELEASWALPAEVREKMYEVQPEGDLVIRVTNDIILSHLKVGMEWESTIYEFLNYV